MRIRNRKRNPIEANILYPYDKDSKFPRLKPAIVGIQPDVPWPRPAAKCILEKKSKFIKKDREIDSFYFNDIPEFATGGSCKNLITDRVHAEEVAEVSKNTWDSIPTNVSKFLKKSNLITDKFVKTVKRLAFQYDTINRNKFDSLSEYSVNGNYFLTEC